MLKISIFSCIILILIASEVNSFEKEYRIISSEIVNIREGPSKEYKVIQQIKKGSIVEIIEESNNWVKISVSNGKFGWINKNLTDIYSNNSYNPESESLLAFLKNPCCYVPIVLVVISMLFGIWQTRCPNCGKFYAGKKVGEENLGIGTETDYNTRRAKPFQYFNHLLVCKHCGQHFKMSGKRSV